MKPRIFVGSSVERLSIAYLIQENLEHDANITVWTQGIFQLSSNSLDDLLKALDTFDYAIFVFHPDDVTKIRQETFQTIRDNVVFELGLFIGRLGKDRVYFLTPKDSNQMHLPTDLLGTIPGTYDNSRDDGNTKAALGPFCNQVREKIKNFIFENLSDIESETKEAKRIAIEKPSYWEYLLAVELIESKLRPINESMIELKKGLVVQRSRILTGMEFFQWYRVTINDFLNLVEVFKKSLQELTESFGPPGVPGKVIEIKNAVDRIIQICKELIAWEYELQKISPPEELMEAKRLMQGWSGIIIDQVSLIPSETRKAFNAKNGGRTVSINLKLEVPDSMETVNDIFKRYNYYTEM